MPSIWDIDRSEQLTLEESGSYDYGARTKYNAQHSDLTLAIALDFNTSGERLTKRCAGESYVALTPSDCFFDARIKHVIDFKQSRGMQSINVAGNGIYTWCKRGWTQSDVCVLVLQVLKRIHEVSPISLIISGGQTGTDIAGLVASVVLGIPALGVFPAGFRQRNRHGVDILSNPDHIRSMIMSRAQVGYEPSFSVHLNRVKQLAVVQ